jgi:hypothetical protein
VLAPVFSFLVFNACLIFRQRNQAALFLGSVVSARIALHAIFTAGLGIVAMPVFSPPAFAAEWSMTPALRLGYEQNDNIRMTLQPHNTVHGSTIAPKLDMGVRSAIWGITGSAEVARRRYSGEEDLDRDIESFRLVSLYRTERNNFELNASRVNDTTLPEELNDPDLGRVTVQKSRRTETVQPTWRWSMTERAQIQLSYQLSETAYPGGESIGLFDYQNRVATATWSYMLSSRSQFFLAANYSKFRVPNTNIQSVAFDGTYVITSTFIDADSRTKSFRTGFNYAFSDTMQGTLMLGQRKTETERAVIQCLSLFGIIPVGCFPGTQLTDDTGTTFSGDLKKKFDKFDMSTAISRDIAASGTGSQVEWDTLSIRLDRPFTARLKGTLAANGSKSRNIDDVVSTTADIKQYTIQPAVRWQWTREANLSMAYQYRHLKRENEVQAVQSRTIYLTFIYNWTKLSISR